MNTIIDQYIVFKEDFIFFIEFIAKKFPYISTSITYTTLPEKMTISIIKNDRNEYKLSHYYLNSNGTVTIDFKAILRNIKLKSILN